MEDILWTSTGEVDDQKVGAGRTSKNLCQDSGVHSGRRTATRTRNRDDINDSDKRRGNSPLHNSLPIIVSRARYRKKNKKRVSRATTGHAEKNLSRNAAKLTPRPNTVGGRDSTGRQVPRTGATRAETAWDRTEPATSSEIVVAAEEAIPCSEDLYPITKAAEETYKKEGARSVCIQIGQKVVRYHLSKLRLIIGLNNQIYNLFTAANLLNRVVSASLLHPELIEDFKLRHADQQEAQRDQIRDPPVIACKGRNVLSGELMQLQCLLLRVARLRVL
ncbi:hypothetical protein B0H13DRAFT_1872777 [Mycena leptocephala]|nr:hypothetical protein B0H13DRAFT_1872777 [Mycena leptocephala]